MKKTLALLIFVAGPMAGGAQAGDRLFDVVAPYLQRLDSITDSAGNAKEVNAVTHVIDPWPRHAGDRRIPANGERMVGAIERYRDVRKLREAPPPIMPTPISPSGFYAGTGIGAPPVTGSTAGR